jgi:hypothetical protein
MTILESHDFGDAPRVVATGTYSYMFFKLEKMAGLGRGNVRCQFVRASLSCHEIRVGLGLCHGLSSGTGPASDFLSCE